MLLLHLKVYDIIIARAAIAKVTTATHIVKGTCAAVVISV